jgi:glycosyltransferase 2 family protein
VRDTVNGDPARAALRSPSRRPWLALGSVLLSAALVVLCIICVDAREAGDRLRGVEPRWLLAFFVVYLLQIGLLGLRWSRISRQLGVPLRWRRASAEYALSVLLNNVLPTGFAGDGLRAVRHSQRCPRHGFTQILEALALDRVSGQLALLLIVVASIPITLEAGLLRPSSVLLAGCGLVAVAWGLFAWTRRGSQSARAVASLHAFVRRASSVMLRPARAAVHLPLSLLLTATLVLQLWLAARAAGIGLDFGHLCWLGPLIVLAASAPSFFGSWGVREGASALLFSSAGLPSSAGVSLSLLFGCFSLISALPGAVVLWFDGPLTALERSGAPAVEVPDVAAD